MNHAAPPLDPVKLREDFPILSVRVGADPARGDEGVPLVYLDNAATTQRPRSVIQSLVDVYEQSYSNVHRGAHWLSGLSTAGYNAAREKVQKFLNAAHFEEIIFTRGTTEAINLVTRSWGDRFCQAGDEIILTELEHHANLVPWQQLAERVGVKLRTIPINDQCELDLEQFDKLLSPRTKLVSFTATSNVTGTITPVAEIIARAKRAGAVTLVDAAQCAPHMPIDVRAWGADFVALSGHKMLGPSGIGALYGRRELLVSMPPFLGGGGMIDRVWSDHFTPGDLPYRFEAGTPAIAPAIGLGAAIDYLNHVGLAAIHAHEQRLTARAHELLADIPGVKIWGPAVEHKAGIVSFTIDGVHPNDIAEVLDQDGIAVRAGHHCAMPLHHRLGVEFTVRASFYFYNTLAEVEQFAKTLAHAQRLFRKR